MILVYVKSVSLYVTLKTKFCQLGQKNKNDYALGFINLYTAVTTDGNISNWLAETKK